MLTPQSRPGTWLLPKALSLLLFSWLCTLLDEIPLQACMLEGGCWGPADWKSRNNHQNATGGEGSVLAAEPVGAE